MQISIISVTDTGSQLTASGYTSHAEMEKHIRERVHCAERQTAGNVGYTKFIAIITKPCEFGGLPVTEVHEYTGAGHFTTRLALRGA